MQFKKTGETYIIKIEQDEEVISTLTTFCAAEHISNAYFSGIGAAKHISCGYYELGEKKYHFTSYEDLCEVVSLSGNVMLKEGKPFIHAHGMFTNTNNEAFGGHIEKMTAGIVVEVILTALPSSVERTLDDDIGLFLINCGD